MKTRILVTGGAGFIGSHTCKALARAGFLPVVVDNFSAGQRAATKWGPTIECDLSDRSALFNIFRTEQFGGVIHFAGSIEVGRSLCDPGSFYRNNVINSINLLDTMVECEVSTVVFSSTAAVYGMPQTSRLTEQHQVLPINPYGDTKLAIERALHWYGNSHNLRWTVLRYFNAAGADFDGELGESHDPETHLIPLIIGAGLKFRPPITVMGTDYPTPDGTAIRDYVHVADLADAHVLALRRLFEGGSNLIANLGTGNGASVRDVLTVAENVLRRSIPVRFASRRPGDPAELVADPSLARAALGWRACYSDLSTIIATAADWHWKQNFHENPPWEGKAL